MYQIKTLFKAKTSIVIYISRCNEIKCHRDKRFVISSIPKICIYVCLYLSIVSFYGCKLALGKSFQPENCGFHFHRWVWCLHHCVLRQRYPGAFYWWDCGRSDRLWFLGHNTHPLMLVAWGRGTCASEWHLSDLHARTITHWAFSASL